MKYAQSPSLLTQGKCSNELLIDGDVQVDWPTGGFPLQWEQKYPKARDRYGNHQYTRTGVGSWCCMKLDAKQKLYKCRDSTHTLAINFATVSFTLTTSHFSPSTQNLLSFRNPYNCLSVFKTLFQTFVNIYPNIYYYLPHMALYGVLKCGKICPPT